MRFCILFVFSMSFVKVNVVRWNKNVVNVKKEKEKREKNRKDRNNQRGFVDKRKKRFEGVRRKKFVEEERREKLRKE